MKANQTAAVQKAQQCCDVAGSINNLRISGQKLRLQIRNDPPAAVAATRAEDRPDFRVSEHLQELCSPSLDRAGKVSVGRGDSRPVKRPEAQLFQFPATILEEVRFDVAGGRDNTNKVARA